MRKKIYSSFCCIAILAVLLTAALSMWSFYHLMIGQARSDLAWEYEVIEKGLKSAGADTGADSTAVVAALDQQFFRTRMTLVDQSGQVLYDSGGEIGLENHAARPEVISAFATGSGESIRNSETTGESTFYYARKLSDNYVLRIAKPTRFVNTAFQGIVPVMLLILILIAAIGLVLSSRLASSVLRPIGRLAQKLDEPGLPEYEELEPFFRKIREQNTQISTQMDTLREERDTVQAIISNMREGLILVDPDSHVLSINPSALELLGTPPGASASVSLLAISRVPELHECVGQALIGTAADRVFWRGQQALHIFASPVYNEQHAVYGGIILLLDVTEQQRAERIRREFSANVSHELKTPLTSISGFAEMIENGMVESGDDVKKFAGRIYSEASRLISLTDDIIRLSRIEQESGIEPALLDLQTLCADVRESLAFAAQQKQVEVTVSGDSIRLRADIRMLEELVYNLIENAIKYNRPHGTVEVQMVKDTDAVLLSVRDTGIGIPLEHQDRIFERFYRVDKSRSKQTGGTGLGLSIVKHVAERHGGTVTVTSRPGEGSTITVRLPIYEES